jgi:hypothetical protein
MNIKIRIVYRVHVVVVAVSSHFFVFEISIGLGFHHCGTVFRKIPGSIVTPADENERGAKSIDLRACGIQNFEL